MRRRPDWALGFCLLCREADQGNQAYGNGKQNLGGMTTHEKWSGQPARSMRDAAP
jgi:hypothetical protein